MSVGGDFVGKSINIFVDGMTCQSCCMKIEKALSKLNIVQEVSIIL